ARQRPWSALRGGCAGRARSGLERRADRRDHRPGRTQPLHELREHRARRSDRLPPRRAPSHALSVRRINTSRKARRMTDSWLPSLLTETPEEGYALAVRLSRTAVKFTQPSAEIRERVRAEYAEDFSALIAISQVVATNFQTVSAANGYWRSCGTVGSVAACPRTGPTPAQRKSPEPRQVRKPCRDSGHPCARGDLNPHALAGTGT